MVKEPVTASYLPLTDSGMLSWSANFSAKIGALVDPTTVGLTAQQVTDYATLQADYDTKLTAATDPATRGGATIFAKNEAKEALIAESRKLAMIVTNHPGVTDQQRYDYGLTVKDTEPSPVPVPSTSPTIDITGVTGNRISLRLHNGESTSRAKPVGVKGATVLTYLGETAPTSVSDWTFEGNTTRTIVNIDIPASVTPGTKVWITAFWFNTKAESGPATPPVSTNIPGGGLSQAA